MNSRAMWTGSCGTDHRRHPGGRKSPSFRHPRNIVWISFAPDAEGDGPGVNKYTRGAASYRQWLSEGTLVRDTSPSLYYYEQEFSLSRRGVLVPKRFHGA